MPDPDHLLSVCHFLVFTLLITSLHHSVTGRKSAQSTKESPPLAKMAAEAGSYTESAKNVQDHWVEEQALLPSCTRFWWDMGRAGTCIIMFKTI